MRKTAPLALTAIALFALVGCSAGGGSDTATPATDAGSSSAAEAPESTADSSQSVEDACAIANERMTEVQSDLNDSLSGMTTGDYTTAIATMETLSASLDTAIDEIGNSEVKDVLTTVSTQVGALGGTLQELADAGSDATAMSELAVDLNEQATALQTAGTELVELCS